MNQTNKTYRRLVTGLGTFVVTCGLLVGFASTATAEDASWRYDCKVKEGVTEPKGADDFTCQYITGDAAATPPASDVVTSVYPATQGNGKVTREPLGMNEWMGTQIVLPTPVPDGQWLLLHGDVQGNGTCAVMVFGPGETPEGVSQATWQAYLLNGGSDAEKSDVAVKYIAQVAARETGGVCPIVRSPEGMDLTAS